MFARLSPTALLHLAPAYKPELRALPLDARGLPPSVRATFDSSLLSRTSAYRTASAEYLARYKPAIAIFDSEADARFVPYVARDYRLFIMRHHVDWLELVLSGGNAQRGPTLVDCGFDDFIRCVREIAGPHAIVKAQTFRGEGWVFRRDGFFVFAMSGDVVFGLSRNLTPELRAEFHWLL